MLSLVEEMDPFIDLSLHKAVLFDLDGVVVKTTAIHAATIKCVLDDFLKIHANRNGLPFASFDSVADYLKYMDGRVGYEAFANFLKSRQITLPLGSPEDSEEAETLFGFANKKNRLFLESIRKKEVETYPATLTLIRRLRSLGIKTALASSSKNGRNIIEKIDAAALFDVVLDGNDVIKQGLQGKPAPDIFLKASFLLNIAPSMSVVIEDSLSGVEAGKKGGYALVVGVDRSGQRSALLKRGATIVISGLEELHIKEP